MLQVTEKVCHIKIMYNILENVIGIKSLFGRQFIVYGMVALIPTAVDFSLLYFLTEFVGIYYMSSLVIAFTIALFVSYVAQKKLTFRNGCRKYTPQFSVFCLVSLMGLAINALIVFSAVEYFNFWYIYGKILATATVFVWNFSANKYITFEKFK